MKQHSVCVPSLQAALTVLADGGKACVWLDHGIAAADAVDVTTRDWFAHGWLRVDWSDEAATTVASEVSVKSSTLAAIDYMRAGSPANTSLVFIDPGAAGGFILVSDPECEPFIVNIDRHARSFLIDSNRPYFRPTKPRRHGDVVAFRSGLLDILQRRERTIVVLGRNWTRGWHSLVYELLQRGVGVLLFEETGTTRNCADCTGRSRRRRRPSSICVSTQSTRSMPPLRTVTVQRTSSTTRAHPHPTTVCASRPCGAAKCQRTSCGTSARG